jgi:hypothetical protein
MLMDGVRPTNLLEDIESTFQARVAKVCKKSLPPSNGFANKPAHAAVAHVLKEAEPNGSDRRVRPARPFGQYLPFHLTRKSDAHAIYEQLRFQDWHYFSCNSGLIRLWAQMQAQLTFSPREETITETMRRDGIAVASISEFASAADYPLMTEDYRRRTTAYEERLAGLAPEERSHHKPFLDRVATAEDLPLQDNLPWNALYLNQGLAKIAAAHLGMVPRLGDIELWRSKAYGNAFEASQKWHRDGNERSSVKVFLYLSDVGAENGPLEYVLGSHYGGPRHDLLRDRTGRIEDEEMEAQIPENAVFRAMGPAGTLVIFDSGGLHCGSRVLHGDRRVAKMTYSTNADIAPQPLLLSEDLTLPADPFMREVLGA